MTYLRFLATAAAALALLGGGVTAQTVPDEPTSPNNLDLPANVQLFGKLDPNVRKPTAVINDYVITGTDVDQRVALVGIVNNAKLTAEERDKLKLQILRGLIDETLEIQEAKAEEVSITADQINQSYARIAQNFHVASPAELTKLLRQNGSSERSLKRQIEGELAWQRYLSRKISPTVNVGDAEVNAILERLKAQRGTDEYELREIYLKADPANQQQIFANARSILQQIEQGKNPFDYYARNFSEATTRSTGGDLGWIKLSTLPDSLAAAAQQMQVGQIAGPIDTPGGFSILYLADKRQIGSADARDAVLSLKQLTVKFPPGMPPQEANSRAAAFGKSIQALQGCGTVEKIAAQLGGEVVDNDAVRVRDLPPQLQDIMLKLQVGQSTPAFGSPDQGVRALVLCGRTDPKEAALPRADQVQNQLEETRVNLRAQQKLRDLRRDAVIDYR